MQGELFLSFIFSLDIILTHKFVTRVTILFIVYFFNSFALSIPVSLLTCIMLLLHF